MLFERPKKLTSGKSENIKSVRSCKHTENFGWFSDIKVFVEKKSEIKLLITAVF
jgi:hypothetical protein